MTLPRRGTNYRGPVRVLLVSTYELGHQPLHVASPAGVLARAGHEVRCLDLSVDPLDIESVRWTEAVACSVPMHTACRLALAASEQIRRVDPEVPICLYGLYAHLAGSAADRSEVDFAVSGEYEPRLLAWVEEKAARTVAPSRRAGPGPGSPPSCGADEYVLGGPRVTRTSVELGRGRFGLPARDLLPGLDRYARLAAFGETRLAGYVEASHGCAHRCRHCPVPVVYDGRTRLVGTEAVLADVAQLVEMGARHVTFGDPDFLNGPHHAMRVVSAVHGSFPDLTFDVTAKVEHVIAHGDLWTKLAASGCLFVVSAFESASNAVLERLDKGHSPADEIEAVRVLRAAGIEPRPSLMPFTPWTEAKDLLDLLQLVVRCDLVGNVDPVQFAIRLLVPPGSLLLESGQLRGLLGPYDEEHLSWTWRSSDTRLDPLARSLASLAERAGAEAWTAEQSFEEVRAVITRTLELHDDEWDLECALPHLRSHLPPDSRPRLTESWFCCAEPTEVQLGGAVIHVPIGATST